MAALRIDMKISYIYFFSGPDIGVLLRRGGVALRFTILRKGNLRAFSIYTSQKPALLSGGVAEPPSRLSVAPIRFCLISRMSWRRAYFADSASIRFLVSVSLVRIGIDLSANGHAPA